MRVFKGDGVYIGPSVNDSIRYPDPTAVEATYKAATIAAGGTVDDDSRTIDFIGDMISNNIYSASKLALIAAGGSKAMGALNQRAYSTGPSFYANDVSGTGEFVTLDTSTYPEPTYKFVSAAAFLEWSNFNIADSDTLSVIMRSPSTNNGFGHGTTLTFIVGSITYFFTTGSVEYTAIQSGTQLAPDAALRPDDDTTAYVPFVASWHLNLANKTLYHTINGGTDFNATSGERVANVWRNVPCPAPGTLGTLHLTGEPLAELVIVGDEHRFDDALAFAAARV